MMRENGAGAASEGGRRFRRPPLLNVAAHARSLLISMPSLIFTTSLGCRQKRVCVSLHGFALTWSLARFARLARSLARYILGSGTLPARGRGSYLGTIRAIDSLDLELSLKLFRNLQAKLFFMHCPSHT